MNADPGIGRRKYSLFGLTISSEISLPELFEASSGQETDVLIELGQVPDGPPDGEVHAAHGGALLNIENVGRFFVSDGSRIVVEPLPATSKRNIRIFLLGSAFGLLLHQRRVLPLHANAVEIDGRIVAFMGRSGVGKSTLAAWFNDQGFRLIADDVAVVQFDNEVPVVQPGLPRLRLRQSVIEATGRNPAEYALSFEAEGHDKRDVLLPRERVASAPSPLAAVVELSRSGPLLEPITGVQAAEAIIANTYRGRFVHTVQTAPEHWALCMRVANAVPVARASVDFDLNDLDRTYRPLVDSVRELIASAG